MVALKRKQDSPDANGGAGGGGRGARSAHKRSKSATASFVLHLYAKLPDLNQAPAPRTAALDVLVWGTGSMCELGLGPAAKTKEVKRPRVNPYLTAEALGGAHVVDVAVGGMHTLALDLSGRVWLWGTNDSGALGRDTLQAREVLRDADAADSSDDEDGDLNAAELTPAAVTGLPEGQIVQMAATDNLSAVLYANGEVYAWGCFRCNEGLLGFLRDEVALQREPMRITELQHVVQLAGGKDHLLALDAKGIVYAWGNGQQFQLGRRILERHRYKLLEPQQFGLYNIRYIASGDFHCLAIDHDDRVWAWGLNQFGQCALTDAEGRLEDGLLITKPTEVELLLRRHIVALAAGEHHTLALTQAGEVLAWGRYDMKEVGIAADKLPELTFRDAHGKPRLVPEPTPLAFEHKMKRIGCGSHHSFAVSADGVAYAWGFGDTYAPGLGPLDGDVAVPTRIANTATKGYDIEVIGGGGQFLVAGGRKLGEHEAEEREEKYQ